MNNPFPNYYLHMWLLFNWFLCSEALGWLQNQFIHTESSEIIFEHIEINIPLQSELSSGLRLITLVLSVYESVSILSKSE